MMAEAMTLPEDYGKLREFTTQLLAEIKAQAILIKKLRHLVAGQMNTHRFVSLDDVRTKVEDWQETTTKYTRELLGWHLSRSGKATTAVSALEHALIARFGTPGK